MFKRALIFGAGVALGAYMMYNRIYKRITDRYIERYCANNEEEMNDSKTEKES